TGPHSTRPTEPPPGTEQRGGERLVRPLAAGNAPEGRIGQRLPRPRQPLTARDEVEVDRPYDLDLRCRPGQVTLGGERAEVFERLAEQVLAQVEEAGPEGRAVGLGADVRCGSQPL